MMGYLSPPQLPAVAVGATGTLKTAHSLYTGLEKVAVTQPASTLRGGGKGSKRKGKTGTEMDGLEDTTEHSASGNCEIYM